MTQYKNIVKYIIGILMIGFAGFIGTQSMNAAEPENYKVIIHHVEGINKTQNTGEEMPSFTGKKLKDHSLRRMI
ncbi:hypothetical protein CBF34_08545 [Vagococcus penaei]|uniref:Uncharacterized protein n=1 Tax=Vagococcus penaei TaxID=633807 RepID=A0A1Q2D5Y5_9ENTE|nr:hypothetical protein [Vagococcus penaei]AQP53742.1 hypothetical protein BW732_05480 [Vagococcus penaei]RSU00427.1 hypothetical protein CBF34_08545 [Vagococcus penaei]